MGWLALSTFLVRSVHGLSRSQKIFGVYFEGQNLMTAPQKEDHNSAREQKIVNQLGKKAEPS